MSGNNYLKKAAFYKIHFDYKKAQKFYCKAARSFKKQNCLFQEATCYCKILSLKIHTFHETIYFAKMVVNICKKIQLDTLLTEMYLLLALMYEYQYLFEKAFYYYQRTFLIYKKNDACKLFSLYKQIGVNLFFQNKYQDSANVFLYLSYNSNTPFNSLKKYNDLVNFTICSLLEATKTGLFSKIIDDIDKFSLYNQSFYDTCHYIFCINLIKSIVTCNRKLYNDCICKFDEVQSLQFWQLQALARLRF